MAKFHIDVPERHRAVYQVEADSAEEAFRKFLRDGSDTLVDTEYSELLLESGQLVFVIPIVDDKQTDCIEYLLDEEDLKDVRW